MLLEALSGIDARAVVVGFGDYRAELEALADQERVLFTGPLEHRHLVHLLALADACVVPSIFPEAFGMVAAEAAAAGCPPLVARHSGLAEVAEGLEDEYPHDLRHLASFATGDADELAREAPRAARSSAGKARGDQGGRPPRGGGAMELGERRGAAPRSRRRVRRLRSHCQRFHYCSAPMGDEQRLSADELIARSRAQFEAATDFTVAVEEEFALVDASSLDLTNRFEEVKSAAAGTALEEHLVGELIASEVEVRTGRCETFADVPGVMAERRSQLREIVEPMGLLLGATGTHPWADWKDQRIIDTPHYRRNDQLLRYVVWRNNTFGLHVHVAINGPDRAIAVAGALRNFLPELLVLSCSSPFVENVNTGLHSARTQIFTRFFPRCGVPDAFASWDEYEDFVRFLYDTGSITENTQIWWSVRPHMAFPTVEIRICDGQPELAEAQSLAAFAASLTARLARAYDDGELVEPLPHRLIEENFWRALRYGLPGELIDFDRGAAIPARQRIEELIEWVLPVAEEIGAAPYLAVPERNAAERQIERFEGGASLEEIYAEQVSATEKIGG